MTKIFCLKIFKIYENSQIEFSVGFYKPLMTNPSLKNYLKYTLEQLIFGSWYVLSATLSHERHFIHCIGSKLVGNIWREHFTFLDIFDELV